MDEIKAYLSRLRKGLAKISQSEQEGVLEEVQSHIEDGLQDPRMGLSRGERRERLMSELGYPGEMANSMNDVHRRHNWLDVALGPVVFLMMWPVHSLIVRVAGDYMLSYKLGLVIFLPIYFSMILVSRKRRSSMLEGWWLSWTFLHLISALPLALQTQGLVRLAAIFWSALLLTTLSLLVRRIWRSRSDGLSVTLSIQPITLAFATVGLLALHLGILPAKTSGYLENSLQTVVYGTTVACVLIMSQRSRRWVSLITGMMVYVVIAAAVIGWYRPANILFFLASIALLLLGLFIPILLGLGIEYRHTRHNPLIPV